MRPVAVKEVIDYGVYEGMHFETVPVVDTNPFRETLPTLFEQSKDPLKLLEQNGLQPKVFCKANPQNTDPVFNVRSDEWDWIIHPIYEEDLKDVPFEYVQGLFILRKNNIPVESIALAKPIGKELEKEVIKQELKHELKLISKVMGFAAFAAKRGLKSAANNIKEATREAREAVREIILDPVFLAKIGDQYIEIGRWE